MEESKMPTWLPIPLSPAPLSRWKHFKGGEYTVLAIARDSEDPNNFLVLYKNDKDLIIWSRSHSSFTGLNSEGSPRFTPIEEVQDLLHLLLNSFRIGSPTK